MSVVSTVIPSVLLFEILWGTRWTLRGQHNEWLYRSGGWIISIVSVSRGDGAWEMTTKMEPFESSLVVIIHDRFCLSSHHHHHVFTLINHDTRVRWSLKCKVQFCKFNRNSRNKYISSVHIQLVNHALIYIYISITLTPFTFGFGIDVSVSQWVRT